jgi:hypothetical protein
MLNFSIQRIDLYMLLCISNYENNVSIFEKNLTAYVVTSKH